ncbi:MAG: prolyl oligopeptidase family serine peptidase [Motiliproteus sp.]
MSVGDYQVPVIGALDASQQGLEWSELRARGELLCWLQFDPRSGATRIKAKRGDGEAYFLSPEDVCVRSRVHEYGGGAYCLTDDSVVFVRERDQALCSLPLTEAKGDSATLRVLRQSEGYRYGDLVFDGHHHRVLAVEEYHPRENQSGAVVNRLVAIELHQGLRRVLVEGADFYASPRVSPDGKRLAWVSWDHPNQPWLSSSLLEARLDDGGQPLVVNQVTQGQLAGKQESVFQPEYSPEGILYFVSDRHGWWNLYRYQQGHVEEVMPLDKEFGAAQWQLGLSRYAFIDEQRLGCSFIDEGRFGFAIIDIKQSRIDVSSERWASLQSVVAAKGRLLAVAEFPERPLQLLQFMQGSAGGDIKTAVVAEIASSAEVDWPISKPSHIRFETAAGLEAYGFFYPAQNLSNTTEKPPLLVQVHGGPTAMANSSFDALKQYWTTRGFSILDLNYRGSTGYGRDYRHSLCQQWGVADMEDAFHGAAYCISEGWVDPDKVFIRGNSSGGYTVLRALSDQSQVVSGFESGFCSGASLYGISDLARLNQHTHKFESHYLHWLIGDAETEQVRYQQRSPLFYAEDFHKPVIFFQGELDRVVPAVQTRGLFEKLRQRQLEVEYLAFADERHGFKQAQNRAQVLQREFAFYQRRLG